MCCRALLVPLHFYIRTYWVSTAISTSYLYIFYSSTIIIVDLYFYIFDILISIHYYPTSIYDT